LTKILHPTSTPDAAVTKSPEARLGKAVKLEHRGPTDRGEGCLTVGGNPAHGWVQGPDGARFEFRNNQADEVSCLFPKAST